MSPLGIAQRYARALRLTAPKLATRMPMAAAEGYWLTDTLYFFLHQQPDTSTERIVVTPCIADCEARTLEKVISPDILARMLSDYAGTPLSQQALSCARYDMPNRETLAVSIEEKSYLLDVLERRVIGVKAGLEMPALYSPDGRYACFVRGDDLWLKTRSTGAERQLTNDGATHVRYGQEPETNLAAISYRKRARPVGLWSPDSRWFLTHRIDERSVPDLTLQQNAPREGNRPVLHRYKYPFPGDPLPVATYIAIHIDSGHIVTFDDLCVPVLSFSPFTTHRVWHADKHTALTLVLDRYWRRADLVALDFERETARTLLSETVDSGYLDLNPFLTGAPNVRLLSHSQEIIWFSERDGWGHLYLYDARSGGLKNRITQGAWVVRDIVHVDETRRRLLFLANGIDPNVDPAHRTLCSIDLDGRNLQIAVRGDGDVFVAPTLPAGQSQDRPFRPQAAPSGISPKGHFAVVRHGNVERGDVVEIREVPGRTIVKIGEAAPDSQEVGSRHFTALAADGVTTLHGTLFLPSDFDETRRYPLIDYIYPGPQVTHQPQTFTSLNASVAKSLAELGFVTLMLDTRAMPTRSRSFHQIGYGSLLEPQLADHAAVVRSLCDRHPFIDRERIGIIGQSGGGAAAARAMLDYGAVYKVGVAVCGNHDSRYYAAIWSDKYRGPPTHPDAWADQANTAAVHKLSGKLLLISGDMDENVHMSQTLQVADALIRAGQQLDLLIIPNEGHDILMTHGYTQRRVWDYFVQHLLGKEPPEHFAIQFERHELDRYARGCEQEALQ